MRIKLDNFTESVPDFFRRCGYGFTGREGKEFIFARLLSGQSYPRFHIYTHTESKDLIVDLHLDQKKPSYPDARQSAGSGPRPEHRSRNTYHAHSGEYEGELVEQELKRIEKAFQKKPTLDVN